MILVGIVYEYSCLAVPTPDFKKYQFKYKKFKIANDIHEAAKFVWNHFHNLGWSTCHELIKAEFHDSETKKTWSVDECGHTKKDYRTEDNVSFINRYDEYTKFQVTKPDFDYFDFEEMQNNASEKS